MRQHVIKAISDDFQERRATNEARLKRQIESGMRLGRILANGIVVFTKPKRIQNWYDTRTLVVKVTEIFDRNERITGKRICHINSKHHLQIRGKHLRRLLKSMPKVKQVGRMLIETDS